jgi:hypothetical protein
MYENFVDNYDKTLSRSSVAMSNTFNKENSISVENLKKVC